MHNPWISCLQSGITHPGKITRDFPVCCSALPRTVNKLTHRITHKAAKQRFLNLPTATAMKAVMYLWLSTFGKKSVSVGFEH